MGARGTTAALGEGAAEMAEAREFGSARQLKSGRWQARYRAPDGRRLAAATKKKVDGFSPPVILIPGL